MYFILFSLYLYLCYVGRYVGINVINDRRAEIELHRLSLVMLKVLRLFIFFNFFIYLGKNVIIQLNVRKTTMRKEKKDSY